VKAESFPEKSLVDAFYKHDLAKLRKEAGLETEMDSDAAMLQPWRAVKDWSEQSRYELGRREQDAKGAICRDRARSTPVDPSPLVDGRFDMGRRFVQKFAADGNPIQAAFWVETEEGHWFLYVVSELMEQSGPAVAYGAISASIAKLAYGIPFGSEIKVIGPNNPIAKGALELAAPYPRRMVFGDYMLGSLRAEQSIIYPSAVFNMNPANPMTSEDISREILRLMSQGSQPILPSHVTLKDGTTFNAVPFSLELGNKRSMIVRMLADGEIAPRTVPLDEIASIA